MKKILLTLVLIFLSINLYGEKNWIKIEPINESKEVKVKKKAEVKLSKTQPIDKMIQKASIIKQLLDATLIKEKVPTNEKKWFVLNNEESK